MRYTRKNGGLEDYFEGEELERIKKELEEMENEDKENEKYYTFEEVIESLYSDPKERREVLEKLERNAENIRKKHIEKCKKAISNYELKHKEVLKRFKV